MGDAELENIYYDAQSTGGYGGVQRLREAADSGKTKQKHG